MVQLSMTLSDLWPHFKVTTFFEVEYRKNDIDIDIDNDICLKDKVTIAQ